MLRTCWTFSPIRLLELVLSNAHSFLFLIHGGFGAKRFYGRMPFLTPTLLFFPGLTGSGVCWIAHTEAELTEAENKQDK